MSASFARSVALFTDQVGELRRQALVDLAKEALADADAQNASVLGVAPPHLTIVDGRQGANEESVRLGGTIVYLFQLEGATLEQAVDDTFRILAELAPIRTGRYQRSFGLFVNGVEREAGTAGAPIDIGADDEIQITNLQPYARKLERGWSQQAPNGVIEVATATIRQRYGATLSVRFSYDHFPGFEVGTNRSGGRLDPSKRVEFRRAALYPTMTLKAKAV